MRFLEVENSQNILGRLFVLIATIAWIVWGSPAWTAPSEPDTTSSPGETRLVTGYGDKGFEFATSDGNYKIQIQSRFQFRFAAPTDNDPVTFEDLKDADQAVFKLNRARLKIGGNGYRSWLKYFWEYELAAGKLLDFRFMLDKLPYLKVKVGQWKVHFNRERVISSGKQQLADRSHLNRVFTIDRQQGVSFYGHLGGSGLADFNYWVSVLTGMGRGARENDDTHLMYMTRLQWNFMGDGPGFSGSDLKYHEEGSGLIALGAVTNRSPYTRFSTDGGGQLPGFEEGAPGQYRVYQLLEETAIKHRGFSWQQELHWKQINDHKNAKTTTLVGNYFQLGYFLHYTWTSIPKPLELAFRHSIYDPDTDLPDNFQNEFAVGLNWFFNGHLNKLTTEVTYFDFDENAETEGREWRFRLQWDVSI